MLQWRLVFNVIYSIYLWHVILAQDFATTLRMRKMLLSMMRQLVQDSMAKRIATEHIKHIQFRDNQVSFGMGDITYQVRHKYRRMGFMYKRAIRYQNHITLSKFVDFLVETDSLGVEIEELVRMAEIWEDPDRTMTTKKKKMNFKTTLRPTNVIRMMRDRQIKNSWNSSQIQNEYIKKIEAQNKRDVGDGFDSDQ